MGFAVLHLDKAHGSDSKMSDHIERKTTPKNADPTRTHLNRELIEFPGGVTNRNEAISHRLKKCRTDTQDRHQPDTCHPLHPIGKPQGHEADRAGRQAG